MTWHELWIVLIPVVATAAVTFVGWLAKWFRSIDLRLTRIEILLKLPLEKRGDTDFLKNV